MPATINTLPDETLLKIFKYLNILDLVQCGKTSQRWRAITTDSLQKILKYIPNHEIKQKYQNDVRLALASTTCRSMDYALRRIEQIVSETNSTETKIYLYSLNFLDRPRAVYLDLSKYHLRIEFSHYRPKPTALNQARNIHYLFYLGDVPPIINNGITHVQTFRNSSESIEARIANFGYEHINTDTALVDKICAIGRKKLEKKGEPIQESSKTLKKFTPFRGRNNDIGCWKTAAIVVFVGLIIFVQIMALKEAIGISKVLIDDCYLIYHEVTKKS